MRLLKLFLLIKQDDKLLWLNELSRSLLLKTRKRFREISVAWTNAIVLGYQTLRKNEHLKMGVGMYE